MQLAVLRAAMPRQSPLPCKGPLFTRGGTAMRMRAWALPLLVFTPVIIHTQAPFAVEHGEGNGATDWKTTLSPLFGLI